MKSLDKKRLNNAYVPGNKSIISKRRLKATIAAVQIEDTVYGPGKF